MPKVYQSADEIPADFRDDYEEKDGAWHFKMPAPSAEVEAEHRKRMKLLTEKKEEERKRVELEKRLEELEREREAHENKVPAETLKKWKAEADAREEAHKKEVAARDAEIKRLKLDDKVRVAALKAGVFEEDIDLVMGDIAQRFDLTDQGSIVVMGEDGQPTMATVDDFFEKEYRTKRPRLFKGTGSSGSGAVGSNGAGGGSGYDPVAAGKAAADAQKKTREQNQVAFT